MNISKRGMYNNEARNNFKSYNTTGRIIFYSSARHERVTDKGIFYRTIIHQACKSNDKKGIKNLLQQLNKRDDADEVKSNNNALHFICKELNQNPQDDCVRHKAKRILAHLLYNNFNPNIQDEHGNTPLHILEPFNTSVRALKSLLDRGANPYIKIMPRKILMN